MAERMGRFFAPLAIAILLAGCATAPEVEERSWGDDCVSAEGQRFLTFCASADAAELARRQHVIEQAADEEVGPQDMVPLPVEGAPVRGEQDAAMTIHYFVDFRCALCLVAYADLVERVEGDSRGLRLVLRHLPVDEASEMLALATIAAAEQGKFWELADEIAARNGRVSGSQWPELAEAAGLNMEQWERDLGRDRVATVLAHDRYLARQVDVVASPTVFINGVRIVGPFSAEELDEYFDEEWRHVQAMEEAGLSGSQISWRRILQNYRPVNWEYVEEAEEELQEALRVEFVSVGSSPQRGAAPADSRVTAVIFADFQCPHSLTAAGVWAELLQRYASEGLRVVFKHFPVNPMAREAAVAAEIAHQRGEFWQVYDAQFGGAQILSDDEVGRLFEQYAGDDGDLIGRGIEGVYGDMELGVEVGVEGTPTVFINGIQFMGVWSADELAPLIEDQLRLGETLMELTGSFGDELYRELVGVNSGE